MDIPMSDDSEVALIIDHDNLNLGIYYNRANLGINRYSSRILKTTATNYGHITIARAYLPKQKTQTHIRGMYIQDFRKYGIKTYEISSYPFQDVCSECGNIQIRNKSLADPEIICDTMELLYKENEIETYVIVSGDKDFIPLIRKIAQNKKRAVVIGLLQTTAKALIDLCTIEDFDYYDYELLLEQDHQTTPSKGSKKETYT